MTPIKRREMLAGCAALAALGAACGAAAQKRRRSPVWKDIWGRALKGYDCVSYFNKSGPAQGSVAFEMHYRGANWLFASMAAMKSFAHTPHKFEPVFGGYCVQTLATAGRLIGCDPLEWDLYQGRLVMLSSREMRHAWRRDPAGSVLAAKAAWRTHFG
ncbi:MAG: hypothetical protein MRY74_01630 [Neomegalonema sp.]|nr:hypothetical protein [Neomegalonema sp.]